MTNQVHAKPCSGCPYRRDCPSGVWDASEYAKLAEYDAPTGEQPIGIFLCHDGDRESTMCRGWLDVHDKRESLALRLGVSMGVVDPSVFELEPSGVPVFDSGAEAMSHGMEAIDDPDEQATTMQHKLLRRHPDLKLKES